MRPAGAEQHDLHAHFEKIQPGAPLRPFEVENVSALAEVLERSSEQQHNVFPSVKMQHCTLSDFSCPAIHHDSPFERQLDGPRRPLRHIDIQHKRALLQRPLGSKPPKRRGEAPFRTEKPRRVWRDGPGATLRGGNGEAEDVVSEGGSGARAPAMCMAGVRGVVVISAVATVSIEHGVNDWTTCTL